MFCVALDPVSNTLAVTGGEDDRAYVWDVCSGDVLFECTGLYLLSPLMNTQSESKYTNAKLISSPSGHKDSVTCAAFSCDSRLVASGDMSGLIKVWRVESKEEIWSFEVGDLEVSLKFVEISRLLEKV